MLFSVLFFTVLFPVSVRGEQKIWEKLGLEKTNISGVTIYYEKALEEQLPLLKKPIEELLAAKKDSDAYYAKKDVIIADINKILGETEADPKSQAGAFDNFLSLFSEVNEFTFHFFLGETGKDFLRAGGELPGMEYDKEKDEAIYKFELAGTDEDPSPESFELSIPITSKADFDEEVPKLFEGIKSFFGEMRGYLAIHEVAELTLQLRLKINDPFIRWFSDGTANVMTYELIKKHISEDRALMFQKMYDIAPYKEIEKEINLRYWMMGIYSVGSRPGALFIDKLENPRYCYSMYEVRRLVDKKGMGCIKEIADMMLTMKQRTSIQLHAVIKAVTGEDINERLNRYQTFGTRYEGMHKYMPKANEAVKKNDYAGIVEHCLRVLEMYEDPFGRMSLAVRNTIAINLYKMGHTKIANETMENWLMFLGSAGNPTAKISGLVSFIIYAIETEQYDHGLERADELLEISPNHPSALTLKMLHLKKTGDIKAAKELAEKLITIANKETLFFKEARKIITDQKD